MRSIISYDRLFVLNNGKIAEFGVPEDLWCRYGNDKLADNDPYNQISLASDRSCANHFLCNVPVAWWLILSMLYGIPAPQHLDRKRIALICSSSPRGPCANRRGLFGSVLVISIDSKLT